MRFFKDTMVRMVIFAKRLLEDIVGFTFVKESE